MLIAVQLNPVSLHVLIMLIADLKIPDHFRKVIVAKCYVFSKCLSELR